MKITVIDPTTLKPLGATRLAREIKPGYLGTFTSQGTRLGHAVMRTFAYRATAEDTRKTFGRLVKFADQTGWILRVEATSQERRAIHVPEGRRGMAWSGGETVIVPGSPHISTAALAGFQR